jgi:hypothetical protein
MQLLAGIYYPLDGNQLLPPRLSVSDDESDDSIGEIDEDDNNGQNNKIDIQHLNIIFGGGNPIPASSRSLQGPK